MHFNEFKVKTVKKGDAIAYVATTAAVAYILCNGAFIGFSKDINSGVTSFNVSKFREFRKNEVPVIVARTHSASYGLNELAKVFKP